MLVSGWKVRGRRFCSAVTSRRGRRQQVVAEDPGSIRQPLAQTMVYAHLPT